MRGYYTRSAIAWLVASAGVSFLWSIQVGPPAWWLMAIASPYVIAYTLGAVFTNDKE